MTTQYQQDYTVKKENMSRKRSDRKKLLDRLTHMDIQKSTISILEESGMNGLTMDKIAEKAGVAKGTLYNHFKNKNEVIKSAVDAEFAPLLNELNNILDGDLAPDEKLRQYLSINSKFFEERERLFKLLIESRDDTIHEDQRLDHNSGYWASVKKISRVLDEGIEKGMFRKMDTMKVAGMFIEAPGGLILQRLMGVNRTSSVDDVDQIMDIFLNGISI